ncbi:hypothetical protein [Gillisia sp. JM1]|uniref:hypothetical protein n=1 Tax=Gillisia sp. JM1 TaxID=1283286 RepID=UPI00040345D6|nr:hypothetical protein [Gillisia sp. JM1]
MSDKTTIEITEKDFWERLKDSNLKVENSQRLLVIEKVHLDIASVEFDYRIIRNVEFKEEVIIEDLELKFGLGFNNCTFRKSITFQKFRVREYSQDNYGNNSLFFNNCNGTDLIIQNHVVLHRALLIENNTTFENVKLLHHVKIGNGGFKIKNSNVTSLIDVNKVETYEFRIENSTIEGIVRLVQVKTNIVLISNTFKKWLLFREIKSISSFTFNHNTFEDTVKIDLSELKSLAVHNDTFYREFSLKLRNPPSDLIGSIEEVYLKEMNFIEGFVFDGANEKINKLTLPLTSSAKGYIKLENLKIDETKLFGINENVKINFKNIEFNQLNMIDFTNLNDINFNRCRGSNESTLNLVDSDLGEMKLNSFSFKSFSIIQIDNISIYKMAISNVQWFDESQLRIAGELSAVEIEKSKREIYRQFKQSLKSSGNILESIDFRAKELRSYRNELKLSDKYPLSERMVMMVNQSNDYGLNWWKPVWIIFLITLGFYIIFLPIFSELAYCFCPTMVCFSNTGTTFLSNFDVFFQLFNPVRKFDSVYGAVSSDIMYLYDLLHRIVLGVFIFQIIRAFRKYV